MQRAMNSGIRAIYGIARFGIECISNLRRELKIPGIEDIKKYVCQTAAWDRRSTFKSKLPATPKTRNQVLQRIPLEDTRGWFGKTLNSILIPAWNDLPTSAKECDSKFKLKSILREHIYKFAV